MKNKTVNTLLWAGFIFYIIILLKLILFKYISPWEVLSQNRLYYQSLNLTPFENTDSFDIIGNILLFIPLGVYLPLFLKKLGSIFSLFIAAIISFSFEIIQMLLSLGATDITDLITNTIGALLGVLLYQVIKMFIKSEEKQRKIITAYSFVLMIALCIIIMVFKLV